MFPLAKETQVLKDSFPRFPSSLRVQWFPVLDSAVDCDNSSYRNKAANWFHMLALRASEPVTRPFFPLIQRTLSRETTIPLTPTENGGDIETSERGGAMFRVSGCDELNYWK